jgi:hypothetical protein
MQLFYNTLTTPNKMLWCRTMHGNIVRYGHLETKERELRDKNTLSYYYGN